MIRNLKHFNSKESIKEVMEHNDKRLEDIMREFKSRKNKLLDKSTKYTDYFEKLLKDSNIFYNKERCFFSQYADLFYSDFYIPSLYLTIEIDGEYHNTDSRRYIDKIKEDFISTKNIATIRYSNEECIGLKNINKKQLLDKVGDFWKDKERENREEWENKVLDSKDYYIDRLKDIFKEQLKEIDCTRKVVMYDKKGIEWYFDNVFDLHFSTEMKFREVIKRVGNYNKRLKYNINYLK